MRRKRRRRKRRRSLVVEEGMIVKLPLVIFAIWSSADFALRLFPTIRSLTTTLERYTKTQHHELCGTRSPATCHPALFGRTVQPLWQELLKKASLSKRAHEERCSSAGTGTCKCQGRVCEGIMLLLYGISVGRQSTRDRVLPCIVCDKAFKSLPTPNQQKLWQHSGNLFVCKGCGKKFKTNNRHKKLVCGKPHHRKSFCNFSM